MFTADLKYQGWQIHLAIFMQINLFNILNIFKLGVCFIFTAG